MEIGINKRFLAFFILSVNRDLDSGEQLSHYTCPANASLHPKSNIYDVPKPQNDFCDVGNY